MRRIAIAEPAVGEEEWLATRECFEGGWLTQGPKVAEFEKAFAERQGVRHAIATSSCTSGLHLCLVAAGIGPGDEVLVPAFTWIATANVVRYCGASPVFVDVDPRTFNMDSKDLASKVTATTRAVIPVHLFGLCADMDSIRAQVPESVLLLEDAACAVGAHDGQGAAGSLGHMGVFSFHPRKSITTGEGGMITTNDDALADHLRCLKNHGASLSEEQRHKGPKPYLLPEFSMLGYNYRMTDMQGAVGLVQLGKADALLEERRRWAAYYREALQDLSWLQMPEEPVSGSHGWQAFVTLVDPDSSPMSRNELMDYLQKRGVSTRPGTHAVVLCDYYLLHYQDPQSTFPGAYHCHHQSLALPLHNRMTVEDYAYVVECLKQVDRAGKGDLCAALPVSST